MGWEKGTPFVFRIQEDGSGLRKVIPDSVKMLYDVSPDGKWLAAWSASASGRSVVVASTTDGTQTAICPSCANGSPPDQPPVVNWSRDGRFVYLHETGLRKTVAIPLRTGEPLPPLPAGGILSPMAAAALPGARELPQLRAFGGPNPSVYAFARVTTHRNIYRISGLGN